MSNVRVLAQIAFELLVLRTRNRHDLQTFSKMTLTGKIEMVITQKLFELQPNDLTCVVILTCRLNFTNIYIGHLNSR